MSAIILQRLYCPAPSAERDAADASQHYIPMLRIDLACAKAKLKACNVPRFGPHLQDETTTICMSRWLICFCKRAAGGPIQRHFWSAILSRGRGPFHGDRRAIVGGGQVVHTFGPEECMLPFGRINFHEAFFCLGCCHA
ncbi:hypothetical protein DQ04_12231020 [Trypanosoma grayi]|uniref:hypothetical protein n=1 Tax=Trypanosoma grayi TaxID=71804 RepID=UPI0004F41A8E|nr:hypothetical protein DQ04_12231020 [Trypanosoma grayi]KEG06792.1 hypothetical protein DQ04_12231020 [Trypanosoma grayi]